MSNFKPGDKVKHDGNEPYVYFGGPVEGVVTEIDGPLVLIEAIPVGLTEEDGPMPQLVKPEHLTMIQEAIF